MKNLCVLFCALLGAVIPFSVTAAASNTELRDDIVAVVIAVRGELELEAAGKVTPVVRALQIPKNSVVRVKSGSETKTPRIAIMTPQGPQNREIFPFTIGAVCFSRKGLKAADDLMGGVVLRGSGTKGIDSLFDWYLPAFGLDASELEKGLELVFSNEGDSLHSGSYEPLTFSLRKNAKIDSISWSLCKDYSDSPVAAGKAEKRGDDWTLRLPPEAIGSEGSYQLVLDMTLANGNSAKRSLALNVFQKGTARQAEETARVESAEIEEPMVREMVLAQAYRQADLGLNYYATLAKIGIVGDLARSW